MQLLIDIVPILPVLIQEFFKFLLILQNQIGKTAGSQLRGDGIDAAAYSIHSNFQPGHRYPSILDRAFYFTANRPKRQPVNR